MMKILYLLRYSPRPLRSWAAAGALVLCGACRGAGDAAPESSRGVVPLDRAVSWLGEVPLEETDAVVNVITYATIDPRGGYLVADMREAQIRRYSDQGRLLAFFGRKGGGPGEFSSPVHAGRLASGEIVAMDMHHAGAIFDSAGAALVRTFRTPVAPLHQVVPLDSLLLLAGHVEGPASGADGARLHVWDPRADVLVSSFFTPAVRGPAREAAASIAGFVSADVYEDEIAAVFSLSDTVYFFGRDGSARGAVPVPARHFRPLRPDAGMPPPDAGIPAVREWVGTFSLMSHVYYVSRDTLVVQYQDRVGTEPRWRIVAMTRGGAAIFESLDTPHLKAVDAGSGEMVFVHPDAEAPNRLVRARLSR